MLGWAEAELRSLKLGDVRRPRRLARMLDTMVRRPGVSLPQTFGSKRDLNAAYYALNSEHTAPNAIRDAHRDATIERISGHSFVLVANDTTNIDLTTHDSVDGLGHLDGRGRLGMLAHTALALTPDGVVLGSLHQQVWCRDPATKGKKYKRATAETVDKESCKWLTTLDAVQSAIPETTRAVLVGDRESDLFDLFAHPRRTHVDLLVRSAQNRRVTGECALLKEAVEGVLPGGKLTMEVRSADGREARTAELTLRYTHLGIRAPKNKTQGRAPIELSVVLAREEAPPPNVKEPLCWLLLTTLPLSTPGDAAQVVAFYRRRWMVERFHFVLKSGCRIEKLQLGSIEALETALALANIVAWKLLNLTHLARVSPDASCEIVFEPAEWEALVCHAKETAKPPKKPPTLREAIHLVAQLGGFLGRKSDGEPGVKTIWLGLQALDRLVSMYAIMTGKRPPRDRLQTFRET